MFEAVLTALQAIFGDNPLADTQAIITVPISDRL